MGLLDRVRHGWNAFMYNRDPTVRYSDVGNGYSHRPDRPRLTRGNERSIVTAIYNRIAMDAAAIDIKHVRLDENGRYKEEIDSDLNECLSVRANIDQTARAFRQDIYLSMMDEGCIAIAPIHTDIDPDDTESYKIFSMRTGRIVQWYPQNVKIRAYDERTGEKDDIIMHKKRAAIVENPFYAVMNEPNSTMQRLIRKLNLLDAVDEKASSGKLDLIIQLPYVVKTPLKEEQAKKRLHDIEDQLKGPYGIAYTDGTERITQLNRPVENNLLKQIEYLTSMLYSQLGITQGVMDGTADEKTMLNYQNRTVEPLVAAAVDAMKTTFLSKTARSQKQSIMYFRDPFKLTPAEQIAEIADKFTRNEIATSNEIRQVIGWKPSSDPKADQLRNSNLNHPDEKLLNQQPANPTDDQNNEEGGESQNGEL